MNDISKLYYYSERGMVNAIVLSIYKYKEAMFHFLKCIKTINEKSIFENINLKDIKEVSIFNEFSLNGFGDPDLIIRVDFYDKESKLFFIEAKVKTYEESVKGQTIFVDDSYRVKGNSSRINFQLRLKQRFVDAYKTYLKDSNDKIISNKDNNYDYKERVLKKKSIINFLNNYIMKDIDIENVYYVSMTSNNNNPYDIDSAFLPFKSDEYGYNKLCYILYKDIDIKQEEGTRKNVVLYNDTKEMFKFAFKLAEDNYVPEADEGDD